MSELSLDEVLAYDVGRIGLFRRLHRMHLGRKILHTVHDIAHSPIVKAVAGGLTFVVPPAGAALTAGLIAADKGTAAIDDARHKAAAIAHDVHRVVPPRPARPAPAPAARPAAAPAPAQHPWTLHTPTRVVVQTVPLHPGIHAIGNGPVAVAEKLVSAHMHGDARVKRTVANIYKRTASLAKKGDPDAKRALVVLAAAKKKLETLRHYTYHVDNKGRVTRGTFKRLPKGHKGLAGYYVRADGHVEEGTFAHA